MNSDSYNEFITASMPFKDEVTKCVVDMANCSYIDSLGLGALIALFDYAKGKNIPTALVNVQSSLKEILTKADFDKIFEISYV